MSKFTDFFNKSSAFDRDQLFNTATKVLKRNDVNATNALGPFINALRISPEVKALIGAEAFELAAPAYLKARAADMNNSAQAESGGVHSINDSQPNSGSAGASSHSSGQ